mgnify:CR=1 FL=1
MATLRQNTSVATKHKLSNTLRNWIPILHSSLGDLGEAMAPFVEGNPVVEVPIATIQAAQSTTAATHEPSDVHGTEWTLTCVDSSDSACSDFITESPTIFLRIIKGKPTLFYGAFSAFERYNAQHEQRKENPLA